MNRKITFALATCAAVGLAGAASAQQAYYSRTYQSQTTQAPTYQPAPAPTYEQAAPGYYDQGPAPQAPGYSEAYRTDGPGYSEYTTTTTVAPMAPPAVREEIVPAPPGSPERVAWVRGHYEWNGAAYVWMRGHYIERPRPGAFWEPGRWVAANGRWQWYAGHWAG